MKPAILESPYRQYRFLNRTMLVLLCSLAASAAENTDSARAISAGPSCWHWNGHFAYRTGSDTNTQIHLVKLGGEKPEQLFTAKMRETVQRPICLGDCVIVANVDGVVRKFDLNGTLVFSDKPAGFDGLCGFSGKFNAKQIYLTETKLDDRRKTAKYKLHLVDVSKTQPVITASFRIRTLGKIVVVRNHILILNLDRNDELSIERLRVPKKVAELADAPE